MPLDDIKDAGILASFTRWGWPWHGVIKGGYVGSTGQPHIQPLDDLGNGNNVSWLIDTGLPAISLTPDEASFYSGLNMEWRNYALIAGGYVYNTYIGNEAYIHIDEAGDAWRVALAYSFPAADTLRITATIQRFGYLRVDGEYTAPAPVVKFVDVACAWIHLTDPYPSGEGPYLSRSAQLQDVHTNGSKALIGVFLRKAPGFGFDYSDDLFSCVDLVFSGVGGETGNMLSMSASESMAYTSLQERDSSLGYVIATWARYAFYDAAGSIKAIRLKQASDYSSVRQLMHFWLLENNTVIDEFGWDASNGGSGWVLNASYGSLASYIPPIDTTNGLYPSTNAGNIIYPWRSIWNNRYEISITFWYPASATNLYFYGIHKFPSKAAAFVATSDNTTVHYGTVSTPSGALTTTLTATRASSNLNFAWQRKTGAHTFDTVPICYV